MELVKRKFLNIGSCYGVNVCLDAEKRFGDEAETSMFMFNNRPLIRGHFYKCIFCRFQHKPMCDKFACMRGERKDGKSVYFGRG